MIHKSCHESMEFNEDLLKVHIEEQQILEQSKEILNRGEVKNQWNRLNWSIKALQLTDLTTLAGDDTPDHVTRLCHRAVHPFPIEILSNLVEPDLHADIHTAGVCVYPARVTDAVKCLEQLGYDQQRRGRRTVAIAAVATGFPAGQCSLQLRLLEIDEAIANGATEIDIVINRQLAITGQWRSLYNELVQMRKHCGDQIVMKAILATGELKTMENVYKASMVCMMAGADFIKTSTGKEAINATIPMGLVMMRAINEFHRKTGRMVGLKAAGGIRNVQDAINWLKLVKEELGSDWLQPHGFRIGASSFLNDCEQFASDCWSTWQDQNRNQDQDRDQD